MIIQKVSLRKNQKRILFANFHQWPHLKGVIIYDTDVWHSRSLEVPCTKTRFTEVWWKSWLKACWSWINNLSPIRFVYHELKNVENMRVFFITKQNYTQKYFPQRNTGPTWIYFILARESGVRCATAFANVWSLNCFRLPYLFLFVSLSLFYTFVCFGFIYGILCLYH